MSMSGCHFDAVISDIVDIYIFRYNVSYLPQVTWIFLQLYDINSFVLNKILKRFLKKKNWKIVYWLF